MIKNEKGWTLLEVVLAIALMGIISVALFGALATAHKVLFIADERTTAESLARKQMEYIKTQPYCDGEWSYEVTFSSLPVLDGLCWEPPSLSKDYAGYLVKASAEGFDADRDGVVEVPGDDEGIRRITVYIYHPEDDEEPLVKLEAYKGAR